MYLYIYIYIYYMYTPTGYMQIKHTAAYTDIMRYIRKYCS